MKEEAGGRSEDAGGRREQEAGRRRRRETPVFCALHELPKRKSSSFGQKDAEAPEAPVLCALCELHKKEKRPSWANRPRSP